MRFAEVYLSEHTMIILFLDMLLSYATPRTVHICILLLLYEGINARTMLQ